MTSSVMTKSLSGNSGLKPRWHIFVWRKYGIDTHHLMLKKNPSYIGYQVDLMLCGIFWLPEIKVSTMGYIWPCISWISCGSGIKMKCSVYIGNGENGLALHKDEKQIMCTFRRFSLLVSMIQKFIYVGWIEYLLTIYCFPYICTHTHTHAYVYTHLLFAIVNWYFVHYIL